MIKHPFVSYDDLAHEYYDSSRHPTCANFRRASMLLLKPHIENILHNNFVIEVGCGLSVAAEFLGERSLDSRQLVLADDSMGMLSYSKKWQRPGIELVCADAAALPFRAESVDVIVSSLGDPYNISTVWNEFARVLKCEGTIYFTAPSYEWKSIFREINEEYSAEFELKNSMRVLTKSWIYSEAQQKSIIAAAGLLPKQVESVNIDRLFDGPISPKLEMLIPRAGKVASLFVATMPG